MVEKERGFDTSRLHALEAQRFQIKLSNPWCCCVDSTPQIACYPSRFHIKLQRWSVRTDSMPLISKLIISWCFLLNYSPNKLLLVGRKWGTSLPQSSDPMPDAFL